MNRIFTLLFFSVVLASCSSSKFRAPVTEDKPLFAAINELVKRPDNTKAQDDLRYFFNQAVARHEEAVTVYRNSADPARWDKLLKELNALQTIYTATQAVPNATSMIQPKNYLGELQATREDAADYYWQQAMDNFEKNDRQSSLRAYDLFRRASSYVDGYKDANHLSQEAWENSIIDVVVSPVREDFPVFFNEWDPGQRYRPDYFQEQLVRELGGTSATYYPARFYTDIEVSKSYMRPEWALGAKWDYINTSTGIPSSSSREVTKQIQQGKDTTGKPVYRTIRATIVTTIRKVNARGTLSFELTSTNDRRLIERGSVIEDVDWTETSVTYNGDRRALSDEDLKMMRALNFEKGPSKTDVMDALARKIFPQLRKKLERALSS
ncbi:MAG: hypothetical protein J7578_12210 [Chitinophagaceae bacterium]|nr:hypothetical protein [Chitinophagaceae bacterium]